MQLVGRTITLTDANAHDEGLHTNRRKRSRDSLVEWSPRLKAAWEAGLVLRQAVIDRHALPVQMRAEHRLLILAHHGEPIQKSSLDSAWQRFIQMSLREGVILGHQRFGIHDLKRKGGTDTDGNRAERQDALGVSGAMMKVCDKSVPMVKPSRD